MDGLSDEKVVPIKAVGVDFDGVLHAYSRGWDDGTVYDDPVPGAFDALKYLMARYAVFIFTSRNVGQVAEWLTSHGFTVDTDDSAFQHYLEWDGKFWDRQGVLLITNRKLGAIAYVDDRGVAFRGDWAQALADVEALDAGR